MKKRLIALGILLIFAVVLAACGGQSMSFSGSHSGMEKEMKENSWKITAKSLNGTATRTVSMDATYLYVDNTNSEGKVFLIITQGKVEKTVEIGEEFSDGIDMSDFEAGRVKLRLKFEKAKNVDVAIFWLNI